jgi:hypothetical protein
MKRLFLLPALMFLSTFFSCKSQEQPNPGPQPTSDPTVYKGVTDPACALEVQFGSYSAGIDGKAFDKIIALINTYDLKYTATNIGREGETRLCLPLKGMSKKKKNEFTSKLKKLVKEGDLVSVSIR